MTRPYNITSLIIRSDRFVNPEIDQVDITATFMEITLNESLLHPFVTGQLMVIDDNSVFERISFSGTETIDVVIEYNEDLEDSVIVQKTFVLGAVKKTKRQNDESKILIFQLIDPHTFIDASKKISRSYTGSGEEIIATIANNELAKNVDISFVGEYPSSQGRFKYVVPYQSPLQAMMTVCDRITSKNGSPFFLSASVYDENLRITSFDKVMFDGPYNESIPFLFAQSETNYDANASPGQQAFYVNKYKEIMQADTFTLMNRGGLSTVYKSYDVFEGTIIDQHISIRKQLDKLQTQEIIDDTPQTVFNPFTTLDSANAREISTVTSNRTFPDVKSFHDVFSSGQARLKIDKRALMAALEKNQVSISVNGLGLFLGKVSVGQVLRFHHLSSMMFDQNTDTRRSGDFLILEIKHIFSNTEHAANISMSKLVEAEE